MSNSYDQEEREHREVQARFSKDLERQKTNAIALQTQLRKMIRQGLADESNKQAIARDLYIAKTQRPPYDPNAQKNGFVRDPAIITGEEEARLFRDPEFYEDDQPQVSGPIFKFPTRR